MATNNPINNSSTPLNGLTLASQSVGFTVAGGTTSKTLTVPLDASVSGTNTGDNAANSSTMFIGTTSQALNRASAAEGLAGITGLTPNADFVLTQNSVAALTSVESGALANTLYLKAGNVGIGTTSPGYKLDIKTADTGYDGFRIGDGNGSMFFGDSTSGVGSFNPTSIYYPAGGSTAYVLFDSRILPADDGGTTPLIRYRSMLTTAAVVATRPLFEWSNYNTPVMDILSSGNVGIGTTSPTSRLHLVAGTATAGTAPLGFTPGVLLTSPVIGKMEMSSATTTSPFYLTTNNTTRKPIVLGNDTSTAGYLTKWDTIGNNLADGLKFSTMADTKWCNYTTADGLTCNSDAPAPLVSPSFTTPTLGNATATTINIVPASGAGTVTGPTITMTSTETQAVGDAVMIDSNGKCHLGKADTLANAGAVLLTATAVTNSASTTYLRPGGTLKLASSPSWTVGGMVYLSTVGTTGNTLSQTAPSGASNAIQILGTAIAADTLLFEPSLLMVEHN
jgi:hypothetical protein